jgi:hypothetical protein
MKKYLTLLLLLPALLIASEIIKLDLPEVETFVLEPYATFDFAEINESSAIIKSRVWDGVYWTLNDSGNKNRIFPFSRDGQMYRAEWYKENQGGIYLAGSLNIDWEEMAVDNNDNIYVCDSGNNSNARKDLCIYKLKDPLPNATGSVNYFQKYHFYYPEQTEFPPEANNWDCEAVFWANEKLYLLTKHRADSNTKLYRFDSLDPLKNNPVTYLQTFDIQGMVTAADASTDGKKLAVLTYNNVWVFEVDEGDDYFNGAVKWLPISAKQCEAVCFDDEETLIITSEQMELFELKIEDMIDVK